MAFYLLSHICQVTDVFQALGNNSMGEYKLDTAYFVSPQQVVWNALFKYIYRPIPMVTYPVMYCIITLIIRGIISHACVCYACANKQFIGIRYKMQWPTSYIIMENANKLNG